MKNFSLSTILGLAFGVLFVGYGVFAFDPPAQAPPLGNAPTPLNTGPDTQAKQGELLLNSGLTVGGALRIGLFPTDSRPSCAQGTIIFDTTVNQPYICDGTNWNEFKGLQGLAGAAGPTGATGPKGDKGDPGPPGEPSLFNTDVVAYASTWTHPNSISCNQPSSGGSRCDAYSWYYYLEASSLRDYDPRGVMTTSFSQVNTPCRNVQGGNKTYLPCAPGFRAYSSSPNFSCSSGFTVDYSHALTTSLNNDCRYVGGVGRSCPGQAVCKTP